MGMSPRRLDIYYRSKYTAQKDIGMFPILCGQVDFGPARQSLTSGGKMSIITVTGANGHLGRLVIHHLLNKGVPPAQIRASVRDVTKAADLRTQGIDVRHGDFDDPASLRAVFSGSDAVLIISTDKLGSRIEQHTHAVHAAKEAGVKHLAYTSLVKGILNPKTGEEAPLASEHRATEKVIFESGIPYTILRNSFYSEFLIGPVLKTLASGVYTSSTGDVPLGCAPRTDYAEATAQVLAQPGHENRVYELTSAKAWTIIELVEIIHKVSGKPFKFEPAADLPGAEGMNPLIRAGMLSLVSPDLEKIMGHPVIPLADQVRSLLQAV
jgi:NAD(P)H dehydrogenase (quinone)